MTTYNEIKDLFNTARSKKEGKPFKRNKYMRIFEHKDEYYFVDIWSAAPVNAIIFADPVTYAVFKVSPNETLTLLREMPSEYEAIRRTLEKLSIITRTRKIKGIHRTCLLNGEVLMNRDVICLRKKQVVYRNLHYWDLQQKRPLSTIRKQLRKNIEDTTFLMLGQCKLLDIDTQLYKVYWLSYPQAFTKTKNAAEKRALQWEATVTITELMRGKGSVTKLHNLISKSSYLYVLISIANTIEYTPILFPDTRDIPKKIIDALKRKVCDSIGTEVIPYPHVDFYKDLEKRREKEADTHAPAIS